MFEVTVKVTKEDESTETYDVDCDGLSDESEVLDVLEREYDFNKDTDSYEIDEWYPANHLELEQFFEYASEYGSSDLRNDKDNVFEAAINLNIAASDIEEAYVGFFKSDEEFAQNLFEQTTTIPKELEPYIDWSSVASDLLSEYEEDQGYYFRIM